MRNKQDMNYIHDLLVKLDSRIDDLTLISARHDENLKEHMRRTEILESELRPVKTHINMVQGVGAFIATLALLATIYMVVK